ncbi:unnamed protein product, partial [Bubo scandiacus]
MKNICIPVLFESFILKIIFLQNTQILIFCSSPFPVILLIISCIYFGNRKEKVNNRLVLSEFFIQ